MSELRSNRNEVDDLREGNRTRVIANKSDVPHADDSMFSVAGKTVVITGVLGQIGSSYAESLVHLGAKVAGIDLNSQVALTDQIPKRLVDLEQESFMLLGGDITNRQSLEDALGEIENRWSSPSGLINNAAIDAPPSVSGSNSGTFEDFPVDALRKMMDVNILGTVVACQVFGGRMAQNGHGSIVNISSIYGLLSPDQRIYDFRREDGETFYKPVGYAVTKSAILNLTRYLATYWARQNVRVNTLTPGGVHNDQDPRFVVNYSAKVPMGRMATPSDLHGAIAFLLSDSSKYMTGTNLIVDGGYCAW